MRTWRSCLGALVLVICSAGGEDVEKPVRYQIEVLYTMHTNVDTDAKLERVRALVLRAYPDARFTEVSAEDRKTYYLSYADRLLRMAGASPPATDVLARREWIMAKGYEIAKAQVDREVALRSIYQFLHTQARDDVSLKTVFDRLKSKDDADNPICGTEPGKTVVYRDFGGKALTARELFDIEDGGIKFSSHFQERIFMLAKGAPRLCRKAGGLGDEWEGRQVLRLVSVTTDAPSAHTPSNAKGN